VTEIAVTLAEADLVAAYRLLGRRNRRQARPVIALATVLAGVLIALVVLFPDARAAFGRSPLLAGLLGAVLLAAALLALAIAAIRPLTRRAARRTLAEHPGMADPIVYRFDDAGLEIVTSRSQARFGWSELHGWNEDPRIVLILLTRQLFYVVPKAQAGAAALAALCERLTVGTRRLDA